jgi:serine/threonine protein kinase
VQAIDSDPFVGSVIAERYRVLAPLGRGGMGAVYRVEHLMMKKELALKLLHPELGRLDEVAKRFEREAEAAARLSHPNIISVTDFGRTRDGMLFLVMELLAGPSLTEVIRPSDDTGRPLEPARALHILEQILRALEHAHAAGIVHRDLKPDNIVLVERDGDRDVVKLLDFGIAKITDQSRAKESLTQAGVVFGTPEYLSPEQAMGEEADGRADLYAAGIILYEMLTGKRPYEAESRVEVISMHLTRAIPTLPVPLGRYQPILFRAMAKKRDQRYPSAATFLAALHAPVSTPFAAVSSQMSSQVVAASSRIAAVWSRAVSALVWRARAAGVPWPRAFIAAAALLALSLVVIVAVSIRPRGDVTTSDKLDEATVEKLHGGHTCRERKSAALKLIASDDKRYLDSLRAARDRRGGFLGIEEINGCMRRELDAAIRKLESK